MKKQVHSLICLGTLVGCFLLHSSFRNTEEVTQHTLKLGSEDQLKKVALEILDSKCNVCHRKKNPFMVFNNKNMTKRAPKIYKMVFVERKMPKGDKVKLTNEEYIKLEKWLFTQNIF